VLWLLTFQSWQQTPLKKESVVCSKLASAFIFHEVARVLGLHLGCTRSHGGRGTVPEACTGPCLLALGASAFVFK
jgi:hypothetical protein